MKLTGLILTYNCENFVQKAINNIPKNILHEIICTDDDSKDNTRQIVERNKIPFYTHKHAGYGGNLFEGLKIAFERGATHVIEIHGDGQYDLSKIISLDETSIQPAMLMEYSRCYLSKRCIVETDDNYLFLY